MGVNCHQRIDDEYKIHERIGSGGFSEVYRVVSRSGRERAAKFVTRECRHLLEHESNVMVPYNGHRNYGTVYGYFFGRHGSHYVLVMDLLGKSVWDLLRTYRGLSIKTVLMLGIQMTRRLKDLHERGYIHCDIKPDNFVVGRKGQDAKYVYLIDYGFSQKFVDSSRRHTSRSYGNRFVGTRSFASKHSHRGEQQSRRSDLESLVYTLIYLIRGKLPWDGLSVSSIRRTKENISAEELCYNSPEELRKYYRAVRNLSFPERPDYNKLIGYLESALRRYGYALDHRFEWT